MDRYYPPREPREEREASDPTAHWIEIERHRGHEAWWLHEALQDADIPFVADVEAVPGHNVMFNVVFVPPEREGDARAIITAYNNPENFVVEEHPELEGIELLTCAECGREFESNYEACPFCFPDGVEDDL